VNGYEIGRGEEIENANECRIRNVKIFLREEYETT
jgi:hypothetical protein